MKILVEKKNLFLSQISDFNYFSSSSSIRNRFVLRIQSESELRIYSNFTFILIGMGRTETYIVACKNGAVSQPPLNKILAFQNSKYYLTTILFPSDFVFIFCIIILCSLLTMRFHQLIFPITVRRPDAACEL